MRKELKRQKYEKSLRQFFFTRDVGWWTMAARRTRRPPRGRIFWHFRCFSHRPGLRVRIRVIWSDPDFANRPDLYPGLADTVRVRSKISQLSNFFYNIHWPMLYKEMSTHIFNNFLSSCNLFVSDPDRSFYGRGYRYGFLPVGYVSFISRGSDQDYPQPDPQPSPPPNLTGNDFFALLKSRTA